MDENIFRAPSNEERQDYRQIGGITIQKRFLKALSAVHDKFTRDHLPFDAQCAALDFTDVLEDAEKESERKYGYVRVEDIRAIKFDDLEKYGDENRFELLEDDEEREMQNINAVKTAVITGHTIKYRCKNRNHGISVFMPMDVYDERFGKKKLKEDK